jgi:hypothetical protein
MASGSPGPESNPTRGSLTGARAMAGRRCLPPDLPARSRGWAKPPAPDSRPVVRYATT